jgi:hypothetical protein
LLHVWRYLIGLVPIGRWWWIHSVHPVWAVRRETGGAVHSAMGGCNSKVINVVVPSAANASDKSLCGGDTVGVAKTTAQKL